MMDTIRPLPVILTVQVVNKLFEERLYNYLIFNALKASLNEKLTLDSNIVSLHNLVL